jgi:hypothetical protein
MSKPTCYIEEKEILSVLTEKRERRDYRLWQLNVKTYLLHREGDGKEIDWGFLEISG